MIDLDRPSPPTAWQYFWLANALLLLTLYGSVIPLRYEPKPLDQAVARFRKIGVYDPELTYARGDWAMNLAQFTTVAFCYMAALGVDRRLTASLLAAAVVVPAAWALAVAIEFVQIYFPPRTVSVNDILVESSGAVLGAIAWVLAGQWLTDWLRRFWGGKGLAALAAQTLPAYLALLLVVHLMPFDVVIRREEIAEKFRLGRIHLIPFAALTSDGEAGWLHVLKSAAEFLPVGALLALTPRWSGRSWWTILGVGLGATATLELLKLFVYTRECDVTDVATGTAAVLLGWLLVRALCDRRAADRLGLGGVHAAWRTLCQRAAGWGPRPWLLCALAWAAILVLAYWQPYHFTTDPARFSRSDPDLSDEHTSIFWLRRMSWAPLVDYYWGSRYQALDQILVRSLCFAPLGALLAPAFPRRRRTGAATALAVALALSSLIEVGKYFIPERHPSVTDLLLSVLGAALGYGLARHAVRALAPAGPERGRFRFDRPGGGLSEPAFAALPKAPAPQRPGLIKSVLECFHAWPYWGCLLLIFVTSVVVPLGLALLLAALGVW